MKQEVNEILVVLLGRVNEKSYLCDSAIGIYCLIGSYIYTKYMCKHQNIIITKTYQSPCGSVTLGSFGNRLCLCDWNVETHRDSVDRRLVRLLDAHMEEGVSDILRMAEIQLNEYFSGQRREFELPLIFTGTDFQKKVWTALLDIPYGEKVSYVEIARRIGMPKAVRAVANATGANSISIIVPCHRVIGSDGSLTGYGGGIEAKRHLLSLENIHSALL